MILQHFESASNNQAAPPGDEARAFLHLLTDGAPDSAWLALHVWNATLEYEYDHCFQATDVDGALAWIQEQDQAGNDVLVRPVLLAEPPEPESDLPAKIAYTPVLWATLSSLDYGEDEQAALDALRHIKPAPTWIHSDGKRIETLWRLRAVPDQPLQIQQANAELKYHLRLARNWWLDSVLTLPGTHTHDGDQPQPVRCVEASDQSCTLADFATPASPHPQESLLSSFVGNSKGETVNEQRDKLFKLALAEATLYCSPEGAPYARCRTRDRRELWPLFESDANGQFAQWLGYRYLHTYQTVVNQAAMRDAMQALRAAAIHNGKVRRIENRVAEHEGYLYLYLNNDARQVVRVTPDGWSLIGEDTCPVLFLTPKTARALPLPVRGGSLDELRPFVNVPDDAAFKLLLGFILLCFHPTGPYAILVLEGEHGSAKSTLTSVIRRLTDPASPVMRGLPASEDDLIIGGLLNRVYALDNLSGITKQMSDAICRMTQGGGHAKRTLYTNGEETTFDYLRPVVVNGIDDLTKRDDFASRSIVLELPPLADKGWRKDTTFYAEFDEASGRIFGAILDALVAILQQRNDVADVYQSRLAEAEAWVSAGEKALGWEAGTFSRLLHENQEEAAEEHFQLDTFAQALLKMLQKQLKRPDYDSAKPLWAGTATSLLRQVNLHAEPDDLRTDAWPKQPIAVGMRLRRMAHALRLQHFTVTKERISGRERIRQLAIYYDGPLPEAQHTTPDVEPAIPTGTPTPLPRVSVQDEPRQEGHDDTRLKRAS